MSNQNESQTREEAQRRAEAEKRQGMGPANTQNWTNQDAASTYNAEHKK
jgi:hypothetical protein